MRAVSTTARSHRPHLSTVLRDSDRVSPLELFFDLVFVLALTQCTALMADEPTWTGVAKGIAILGVLWWSWVGYTWLCSVVDPDEGTVRIAIFVAMAGLLVVALCVPGAFGEEALLFAIAYGIVRGMQVVLLLVAGRDDPGLRHSASGLVVSTLIGVGLLTAASFADGTLQGALWAIALAARRRRAAGHRRGRLAHEPGALRRAPRADHHHRARRVDRRDRRRRRGGRDDRRGRRRRARRRGRRGAVVAVLRRRGAGRGATAGERRPRARSATASAATPSPTCTSRWSPGSCSSRSA